MFPTRVKFTSVLLSRFPTTFPFVSDPFRMIVPLVLMSAHEPVVFLWMYTFVFRHVPLEQETLHVVVKRVVSFTVRSVTGLVRFVLRKPNPYALKLTNDSSVMSQKCLNGLVPARSL